ncbi:Hint domain-containing protein [Paracoccus sp. Z330]|uniref:Hint domain-containing protein n=1 Tax=Paracoccus onchidii TaxID=3017813 RepID=A0ABT4ZBS9_9RHOB|nr:Hint domain-containing protein [Paracoccus onchidii]MDB6176749.1 Hint domain-containing protein [Paracoccus onchidii]
MPTTWNGIYLGHVAQSMDPQEGNNVAENAGSSQFVGQTFGSATEPLYEQIVSVEAADFFDTNSTNGTSVLNQNNSNGTDEFTTDIDADGVDETYQFDAGAAYWATITYFDGTTETVAIPVFQATTGDLFVGPSLAPATNTILASKAITSIRLDSLIENEYSGVTTSRPVVDFACFAAGTMIATPAGDVRIEDLSQGDLVLTADQDAQQIQWIGGASVDLVAAPNMRPVRISAGALGQGLPSHDLIVSPQHRVLVRSKIAQRMFGTDEVLVAAKQLLELDGIALVQDIDSVTYYHFLFDRHQMVWSNGALTESLFTGPEALKSVGPAARDEILALFPELENTPETVPARPIIPGRKARQMAARHVRNGQSVLS